MVDDAIETISKYGDVNSFIDIWKETLKWII
jgi:hypothetical protein